MCGIITAVNKTAKGTANVVLEAYARQSGRGSDGFGFVSFTKGGTVQAYKRCQSFATAEKLLRAHDNHAIMFHHRYPTSTPNIADSNHPIRVQNKKLKYTYYVIHNGVITNDDERRSAHETLGFKYSTALANGYQTSRGRWYYDGTDTHNDSEALAIDLALFIEGHTSEILAKGASAYVVLQVHNGKLRRLFYGRNGGNPLYTYRKKGTLLITSQNVTGKGSEVRAGVMYGTNARGVQLEERACTIPTYTTSYGFNSTLFRSSLDKYDDNYSEKLPVVVTEKMAETNDKNEARIAELEEERENIEEFLSLATDYVRKYEDDSARDEVKTYGRKLDDIDAELTKLYAQV